MMQQRPLVLSYFKSSMPRKRFVRLLLAAGARPIPAFGRVVQMNSHRFVVTLFCTAIVLALIGCSDDHGVPSTQPSDKTPAQVARFSDYDSAVMSVAFSPDGKLLATSTEQRTVIVWDWQAKKRVLSLKDAGYLCVIMPDSRTLAVCDSGILSTWDLTTGKKLRQFGYDVDGGYSFAPTGRDGILLCGGRAGLTLWDLRTGEWANPTIPALEPGAHCADVSPGGRFAVSGSADGSVRVWSLQTGAETAKLHDKVRWFESVAISPDGRYVLASSSDDESIRLWDMQTQKIVRRFKASAPTPRCTAFSPDGSRFMFTDCQVVHLWDLNADREICQLKGHEVQIEAVCFSPDGIYAATASGVQDLAGRRYDTTARVWRLPK